MVAPVSRTKTTAAAEKPAATSGTEPKETSAQTIKRWAAAHEALWGYPPSDLEVKAAKAMGGRSGKTEVRTRGLDHLYRLTLDQLRWAGDDSGSIDLVETWVVAELDIRQHGCGPRSAAGKEIAFARKEITEFIEGARG